MQLELSKGKIHAVQINAEQTLKRAEYVLKLSKNKDLASSFLVKPPAVSGWKQRGSIPAEQCVAFARREGVCIDWLMFGEGPMRRDETTGTEKRDTPLTDTSSSPLAPDEQEVLDGYRCAHDQVKKIMLLAARDANVEEGKKKEMRQRQFGMAEKKVG